MSKLRDRLRGLTPGFLLNAFRRVRKARINRRITADIGSGKALDTAAVEQVLRSVGITKGDSVLVHASLSRIGALQKGPDTLLEALMNCVGPEGNLLMPTSPNPSLQLEHVRRGEVFDVLDTPSAMGALSERFRTMPGVVRSWHPTEPISAMGPRAAWFTSGHAFKPTPYDADSPFHRLAQAGGKILYLGVSLIQAGTSLHLLEDAVDDFPHRVYHQDMHPVQVRDPEGRMHAWSIKVHDPAMSARRCCDELIPGFEAGGVAVPFMLGRGRSWVFDAKGMLDHMLQEYRTRGVTMYEPYGPKRH